MQYRYVVIIFSTKENTENRITQRRDFSENLLKKYLLNLLFSIIRKISAIPKKINNIIYGKIEYGLKNFSYKLNGQIIFS